LSSTNVPIIAYVTETKVKLAVGEELKEIDDYIGLPSYSEYEAPPHPGERCEASVRRHTNVGFGLTISHHFTPPHYRLFFLFFFFFFAISTVPYRHPFLGAVSYTSVKMHPTTNFPIIGYTDGRNAKVYFCNDVDCNSGKIVKVEDVGTDKIVDYCGGVNRSVDPAVGPFLSMALDSEGR